MFFQNRTEAGQKLASVFSALGRDFTGWSVMGIARGGVIVGAEVAKTLHLPLQAICIDDLITPEHRVVTTALNTGYLYSGVGQKAQARFVIDLAREVASEAFREFLLDLQQRQLKYNLGRDLMWPKKVIVCDDGLVSGNSAMVVIETLHHFGVKEIILAIPVVPKWIVGQKIGAELVTWRVSKLTNPTSGIFYFSFSDVPDDEVIAAMRVANNA